MEQELDRRLADLFDRCERLSSVTHTGFLSPAEQAAAKKWLARRPDARAYFSGGQDGCERQALFFLPFYLEPETLPLDEYIRAVRMDAQFGEPTHRDYMGAVLALGIRREWIGDFRVCGATAHVFCMPTVEALLADELRRAGRVSLRTRACPLGDVPAPVRRSRRVSFTVKSLRLDAVAGELFGLSRTAAAELIRAGAATLNYEPCERMDAPIREGDVISLRGRGKGIVTALGGRSRKDRLFVEAELLL